FGKCAARTPNLEQLAGAGAVFRNTFSGAAICIPSRAILASGLCSFRNGATANGREMRAGIRTLPSYLKELGYHTAHFGKSHYLPRANYADWEWTSSEIRREALTNDLDTATVDKWLAAHGGQKPLCLMVNSHSPHVVWEQNEGYDPARVDLPPLTVDTPETRAARTRYYTDITKMDAQLGEIYRSVQRHLGDNVLFLATSDNGAQWPFGKWNLYDAGIRMPLVAAWPGVIRKGARSDAMLHFTDFLPTMMEVAGGRPAAEIDGRSFLKALTASSRRHRDEVFASHTADNHSGMNCYPMRAVRTERFKYIRNLRADLAFTTHIDHGAARDGRDYWDTWRTVARTDAAAAAILRRYHQRPAEELYDVAADPHETINLAGRAEHAKTLAALRSKVDGWMRGMNDPGETFGNPRPLTANPQLFENLAADSSVRGK
ncbi:MAG: sulfatase, partial [Bryobacter sp.]|nr:sulfatase [Bryobacter sp.]